MSKIQEAKKAILLKNWREEVEAQMSSKLTVSEWCQVNNISPRKYYYHLRKVREFFIDFKEEAEEKKEIVPVTEINKFASNAEPKPASNIVIRKAEIEVEIPETISPQMLKFLLQEIKSC